MKKLMLLSMFALLGVSCSREKTPPLAPAPAAVYQPPPEPPPAMPVLEMARTWAFVQSGIIRFQGGSLMSVAEGGLLRVGGTNAVLKFIDGANGIVSMADLSEQHLASAPGEAPGSTDPGVARG